MGQYIIQREVPNICYALLQEGENDRRTAVKTRLDGQLLCMHWEEINVPEVQVFHGSSCHQRLLGVVHDIRLSVHADLVVCHIHACTDQHMPHHMSFLVP